MTAQLRCQRGPRTWYWHLPTHLDGDDPSVWRDGDPNKKGNLNGLDMPIKDAKQNESPGTNSIKARIPGDRPAGHLAAIRGFRLEGLYPCEVPRADPLLEEWRRTSLPFWNQRLVEGEAVDDGRVIHQAKWMLELLEDKEG